MKRSHQKETGISSLAAKLGNDCNRATSDIESSSSKVLVIRDKLVEYQ